LSASVRIGSKNSLAHSSQKEYKQMNVREMREKRAALAAQALEVVSSDPTKFEKIMKEIDLLKGDIDRQERAEALEVELRTSVRPPLEGVGGNGSETRTEAQHAEHRKAFNKYLRTGDASELRTYSPMSDSVEGAYIVPQGFQNQLVEALKAFGGVRKVSSQISTATGNDLNWPTANDISNTGELLSENTAVSQANPSFSHVVLKGYTFSTKMVNVSNQLLQDSAIDIEAYLRKAFVTRLGRIHNQLFTTGTGSAQPKGILTAATGGPTTATTLIVTYDDVVELEHSVDPAYRQGAKFMFSDAVLKQIKKLKDSLGHPLWVPGFATKSPDTVLGYEYVINQDMPAVSSGNALALFGAMDNYLIRDVKELAVVRLNERYAELFQTAFIGFARADANMIDAGTHPVKTLVSL
jgi:HK97 family phage major capsid protein